MDVDSSKCTPYTKRKTKDMFENPISYLKILKKVKNKKLLHVDGFEGEVSPKQVEEFCWINKISISVYEEHDKKIYPVYLNRDNYKKRIDLLLLSKVTNVEDNKSLKLAQPVYHYVVITDFDRLMRFGGNKKQFCRFCMSPVYRDYDTHVEDCRTLNVTGVQFMAQEKFKFTKLYATLPQPYSGFFTLTTTREELPNHHEAENDTNISFSRKESNLNVKAYSIVLKGPGCEEPWCEDSYTGEMVLERFLITLMRLSIQCLKHTFTNNLPIKMSDEDRYRSKQSISCPYCNKEYNNRNVNSRKVNHHNHLLSKNTVQSGLFAVKERVHSNFISACCSLCNLRIVRKRRMTFWTHDDTYTSLLFILKSLSTKLLKKVWILPKSKTSVSAIILDSCIRIVSMSNFLDSSMPDLAKCVIGDGKNMKEKFNQVYFKFQPQSEQLFLDLCECEIFSYFKDEHIENDSFPERNELVHCLNREVMSTEMYKKFQNIIKELRITSNLQLLETLTTVRTLMVADIYSAFHFYMFHRFGLSSTHSLSLGSFVYDCAMFKSKAQFEYIREPKLVTLISDMTRGGINTLSKFYLKADHSFNETSSSDKTCTFISGLDHISHYSNVMAEPLPYDTYRQLTESECKDLEKSIYFHDDANPTQFILRVDLHYPPDLHELHDSMPVIPIKTTLGPSMLGDYQAKQIAELYEKGHENPINRMVLSLSDQSGYVLYSKNLKFILKLGIQLKKIIEGFSFNEKPFLKEFCEENIAERHKSTSAFQNSLLKAFNNTLSGSLAPNYKNYCNIKVVMTRAEALELAAKTTFCDVMMINDDVAMFQLQKNQFVYDRPYLTYSVILEKSKLKLYEVYYHKVLKTLGNTVSILSISTDGYYFSVTLPEKLFYERMKILCTEAIDTSNLSETSPFFSLENKYKMGMLKFIHGSVANIKEFVALRSRVYSVLLNCEVCKENEVCSDCSNADTMKFSLLPTHVKNNLNHKIYVDALHAAEKKYLQYRSYATHNFTPAIYFHNHALLHKLETSRYFVSMEKSFSYGNKEIQNLDVFEMSR